MRHDGLRAVVARRLAVGEGGIEKAVREQARLEVILAALPVALLDQPPAVLEGLERVGARTLGDCLRLPREGWHGASARR